MYKANDSGVCILLTFVMILVCGGVMFIRFASSSIGRGDILVTKVTRTTLRRSFVSACLVAYCTKEPAMVAISRLAERVRLCRKDLRHAACVSA